MKHFLRRTWTASLCYALALLIQPLYGHDCDASFGVLAEASVCVSDEQAIISSAVTADSGEHIPDGFSRLFVLTSGPDLIIEAVSTDPEFIVTTDADYRIHSLIYDPATLDLSIVVFGETSAVTVNGLLLQGGGDICAALDVSGVQFRFGGCGSSCLADAGTLSPSDDLVCIPTNTLLRAEIQDAPLVPPGFSVIYVLTSTNSLIIEAVSNTPEFEVGEIGDYRIHTLVYDPATLDLSIVEFGVTTGFNVVSLLQQGGGDICGALDVSGAAFHLQECSCGADAGRLAPANHDCLDGTAELIAEAIAEPILPPGYTLIYVLTSGEELVIEDVAFTPSFTVDEAGIFTIHTLVYDASTLDLNIIDFGVTTGFDVNGLLEQGGGGICGALDVAGARFDVEACPCEAEVGFIFPISHDCLDGTADLSAFVLFPPTVPAGFEVLYVLTSGEELVIEAVSADPEFTVDDTGIFTIHTLVYDPATLDLSIVEFGVTTGFDVNGLLQQGGGDICAALDVAGAHFNVEECPCEAEAGHLIPTSHDCLDGTVELTAGIVSDPVVPDGFSVLYVLTSGSGLVIEAVNAEPEFTVDETGVFTIHTLVYDPATLDLSIVEFGVTTGFDVNGLLEQGGGDICGALDVLGAHFDVQECPCEAEAGHLIPASHDCLAGTVELTAEILDDPNVPDGFSVLYVLTSGSGLVIEAVNAEPEFTVDETGVFTIHTLVYDPATLDLSIVEFGVTTGFDVNGLLIQGGGDICGALDVFGAHFDVQECPCAAEAGQLSPLNHDCLDGTVELAAGIVDDPVVPDGFSVLYVLTSGSGLVIEAVNAEPEFTVDETGTFTIHTLVYDPTTLDLSIVEFGVTTGFDVNGLLIQGGGDICAALDVAGAPFQVEECPCEAEAGVLKTTNGPCLENGAALIDFEELNPPVVPDNYEVLYVLTSGNGLIIEQVSTDTEFTVNTTGRFTAHTLVYNPTTLDLSIVEPGVTSAFAVNSLLIQGGGDICASLDLAGLAYDIELCTNLLPQGTIFPNPVQDVLNIQTPEIYLEQGMRVSVFGINGQLMRTVVIEEPQAIEQIMMNDMPASMYQVVLEGLQGGYRGARVLKY